MNKPSFSNLRRLLLLGAILAAPGLGCAASQPAASDSVGERFAIMDANNDGIVTLEEFRAAAPNMSGNAFVIIDQNGDKGIDREEWFAFVDNHGKNPTQERGAPMNNIPGDPLIPPPDSSDLPLVRPPMGE